MSLNSVQFIVTFIVLLAILSMLQLFRTDNACSVVSKIQSTLILAYSYLFSASVNWKFSVCLILITLISYGFAILIEWAEANKRTFRKPIFVLGISLILTVLAFFKYCNFFIEGFNRLVGGNIASLKIVLPLGLSFYSFSALSYLIDVYRGEIKSEKSIFAFSLFMALFTKFTAGPIVRYSDFEPQFKKYRGICLSALNDGIQIFIFGLFKKMVLADHLGVFVDDVFRASSAYGTATVWWAAISYSLQIYLDFSGYSDMAIGLSKILGFDFKPNFNLPYIAKGFSDFWSRWHISLSQWFRDYLYIPLGGSKKGEARTYYNLFIVMLISGLWHGDGLTFIVWGVLHGIASCVTRIIKKTKQPHNNRILDACSTIVTYFFVMLFWIIFRAESIGEASMFIWHMFSLHEGICQPYTWTLFAILCVIGATISAVARCNKSGAERIDGFYPIMNLSKFWALVVFFTFCGLTVLLGYYGDTSFIYGGF